MFNKAIQFVINKRVAIIAILGLLTIIGLLQTVTSLKVDNSLSIWFLEENKDYQQYIKFQEEQGSDEIFIAMFPVKNSFSETNVNRLSLLHQKIDTLPYVNASFSIANAKYPIYANNKIYYQNIYDTKRSERSLNNLLDKLPVIKKQLISEDTEHLFFYIQMDPSHTIEAIRSEAVAHIESVIESVFGTNYFHTGAPVLNEAYNNTIYNESVFFAVITVIVVLLMLLFLLPHRSYLLLAISAIITPIALLFGTLVSLGYKLNMISMLIPTILLVYSVSDAIHIINMYHKQRKSEGNSKIVQIQKALFKSLKPCFYTTLTTLTGYIALYLSPLPAFKNMGLFTCIGLLLSFVLVYVITAIGFSFMPKHLKTENSFLSKLKPINLDKLTFKLNSFTTRYKHSIIVVSSVLFVIGIFSISKIEVNTDSLNMLGNGEAKQNLKAIEKELDGSTRLQVNVVNTSRESLLNSSTFTKLKQFHEKLNNNEYASSPVSLLNVKEFLEKRSPVLFQNGFSSIKMDSILIKSKEESNTFFSMFSDDFSKLGISVNVRELKTKELEDLFIQIENDFHSIFDDAYNIEIRGFSAVFAKLNKFIIQTQFRSFGAAFIISFIVLFIFIGNIKTSVLVLIPNLLPLALLAIIMSILNIPLEISTVMIAPIMLGIAMDDTIHLTYKYKKNTGAVISKMDNAIIYTGDALFSTTIALVFGFLIIGFSGVISVSTFGLLCAFTVAAALLADLLFLPALIKTFSK
ncbi:RND transporter [Flavobacteriaceae bacterium AU392]|nr:RND transporter [Flavobacteriaceae bacterium]RKM84770.1 RND transporter [Flavobacteriaceae bacterium AU392]